VEEIIGTITNGTMTSSTITKMRRVLAGKITGLGSQGHTTCHPKILLNGPCQMHFYLDNEGKRQSDHLQKDCRTFQALRRYAEDTNTQAANRGYVEGPRSEIQLRPPPAITSANLHQLQPAAPQGDDGDFINTTRAVSMIQKGRPSNRAQKLISRQVYMAEKMPPPTIEYLNWLGHAIGFTQ
jgi:hypothetical protein